MTSLQDKLEKVPDPKKHQIISFVKSGIRILASIISVITISNPIVSLVVLAVGYGIAECIGVYEELV